jgi:uncharacterized membrane protein
MPLYPIPVVLAIGVWLLIFASTKVTFMLSGLAVLALGVVAFLLFNRYRRQWPFGVTSETGQE